MNELELPLNLWEEEPLVASAAEGEEKYDRMTDFLPASREEDECLDELEMNVRGEKKHLLEVRIRGGGIVKDENGRTWRRHQLYGSPTGSADGGKGGRHSICRVYVGNLSWSVSWQDLKDHMRSAGNVVHANVISEDDGRSKGFGIVEYCSPEEAREAISTLTDTHLKGRLIFVREDRVPSKGSPGGFQAHYLDHCSVYVGNLSYETSWQVLKDHMRKAGNVDRATIISQGGKSKGCAIVRYQRPQEAARAIRELQGSELDGRKIFLKENSRSHGSESRGRGRPGRRGGRGTCQLVVNNLSFETTWRDLKDMFRQCGSVERAEIMLNAAGRSKGYGTVRFFDEKDAKAAIERLNDQELRGRILDVRFDTRKH